MLSQEFLTTIRSKNLLRAKIMLKDSLIVDPTFAQFDEMLAYAKRELPDIFVPYDGEILENDRTKWNTDLMNTELVEIVNNFSNERICHLKKVIAVVLADNIKRASVTTTHSANYIQSTHKIDDPTRGISRVNLNVGLNFSSSSSEEQKRAARTNACSQITNSSQKIESIMDSIRAKGKWTFLDIKELEKAANQILAAAKDYKNNMR